jgi:hypothetical protein
MMNMMMASPEEKAPPFARKIDHILEKAPSHKSLFLLLKLSTPTYKSLFLLLKLSTPTLTEPDMLNESNRNAALATLIEDLLSMDQTARLVRVQECMDLCCSSINDQKPATGKRKASPNSPTLSSYRSLPRKVSCSRQVAVLEYRHCSSNEIYNRFIK